MKLALALSPFVLRLRAPLRTARGVVRERAGFRVSLRVDGLVGRGEAAPWEALGTEDLERCRRALEAFVPPALPGSLDDVEAALSARPPLASAPAARAGLEAALLELLALRRGCSVAALLAAAPRPAVEVNALVDGDDVAALARDAEACAAQGFRTLKIKVAARSTADDGARLAALRAAVGPSVRLRADANGGWSEAQARLALRALSKLGLELCEQPVPAGDVEALRRLALDGACPIAADEGLVDPRARESVLALAPRPAADALVLKPLVQGGLLPALRLAERAAELGLAAYVTTSLDGPLARAAAAHLAAALPAPSAPGPRSARPASHLAPWGGAALAHGLATVEAFEGFEGHGGGDVYTPRDGRVVLPTGPGFGACAELP